MKRTQEEPAYQISVKLRLVRISKLYSRALLFGTKHIFSVVYSSSFFVVYWRFVIVFFDKICASSQKRTTHRVRVNPMQPMVNVM